MRDRWGKDVQTGARGLEDGTRFVHGDGYVLIGGEIFEGKCLAKLVGEKVRLVVANCWATEYSVYDPETNRRIGDIRLK